MNENNEVNPLNESGAPPVYDAKESEADIYKCPGCGANLVFSGNTRAMVCRHCGYNEAVEINKNVTGRDFAEAEGAATWSDTRVFVCDNCGAKEVISNKDLARACAFCGSTSIIKTEELSGVKPDSVLPFAFDDDKAGGYYTKWIKGKFFAPSKLKKNFNPDSVKGIYCPSWVFDSFTRTDYNGKLGQRKTRTVGSGNNKRVETYIEWFRVRGAIDKVFNDIMIRAGSRISQTYLNRLQPFPKDGYAVYSDKYLAGFMAEHYEKDIHVSFAEAERVMLAQIKTAIMRKYNADVWGTDMTMAITHLKKTFKYTMLPIYLCAFGWGKKVYNFYINGVTGRVTGKTPVSGVKVTFFSLLIAGLLTGAYFLWRYFGG